MFVFDVIAKINKSKNVTLSSRTNEIISCRCVVTHSKFAKSPTIVKLRILNL